MFIVVGSFFCDDFVFGLKLLCSESIAPLYIVFMCGCGVMSVLGILFVVE